MVAPRVVFVSRAHGTVAAVYGDDVPAHVADIPVYAVDVFSVREHEPDRAGVVAEKRHPRRLAGRRALFAEYLPADVRVFRRGGAFAFVCAQSVRAVFEVRAAVGREQSAARPLQRRSVIRDGQSARVYDVASAVSRQYVRPLFIFIRRRRGVGRHVTRRISGLAHARYVPARVIGERSRSAQRFVVLADEPPEHVVGVARMFSAAHRFGYPAAAVVRIRLRLFVMLGGRLHAYREGRGTESRGVRTYARGVRHALRAGITVVEARVDRSAPAPSSERVVSVLGVVERRSRYERGLYPVARERVRDVVPVFDFVIVAGRGVLLDEYSSRAVAIVSDARPVPRQRREPPVIVVRIRERYGRRVSAVGHV